MSSRSPLQRLYRFTWRYKMTPPGKLLTAMIGIASIGTVSTEVPIYFVCCGFLGLIFAAELTGAILRPRLRVEPRWPATLTAGEAATIPVRVTNLSWRPALDVMLTLLERPRRVRHVNGDVVVSRMGKAAAMDIPLELKPMRRGPLRVPAVDAHSTFPFNLVRIPGGRSQPRSLLVRPTFVPLAGVRLPHEIAADLGEYAPSGDPGESIEYLGNRDYTPGEPIKRLDFRAWARTGTPVVREYQNEQATRIGVVIDSLLPRRYRRRAERRLEASISLGVAVCDAVLRGGYDVGLLATGTDLYAFDEPDADRLGQLLDLLAELMPTPFPSYARMVDDLLAEADSLAAVVVIVTEADEETLTLLRRLHDEGPAVRAIWVTDDREPGGETAARIAALPVELEPVSAAAILAGDVETLS